MNELLLYGPVALPAMGIVLLVAVLFRVSRSALLVNARLDAFEKSLEMTRLLLREEVAQGRDESGRLLAELRRELAGHIREAGGNLLQRVSDGHCAQGRQFDALAAHFGDFSRASLEQLARLEQRSAGNAKALREEVVATLTRISETATRTMGDIGEAQDARLNAMAAAMNQLSETNAARLETVRATVEERLRLLQADNASQLESMRQTVDEKLQGTLEKRLGESFRQVSERLEQVHKGLGEMQTLATGVGDLKKVLTNVKTRGTWGEVQLGALLEQVLNAEQYVRNASTRDGAERVEFAIKLPGQDGETPVLLPIDAKFPVEDYQRLLDAQERADAEGIEAAGSSKPGSRPAPGTSATSTSTRPPARTSASSSCPSRASSPRSSAVPAWPRASSATAGSSSPVPPPCGPS